MSKKFYGDIELMGGGAIFNLSGERLSEDPELEESEEGRIIYNTTESAYKYNNGSAWLIFEVSVTASNALVETLGTVWINENFSFNPDPFNDLDNVSGLTATDSLFTVIEQLDAGITDAKIVVTLQGVPLNFDPEDLEANNIIFYDGAEFVRGTINDLDTLELNVEELADVTITDLADNEALFYQDGAWVNKKTYFQYQELSGTVNVFVVNHELGVQFCNVEVIDMSSGTPVVIDPADIVSIAFTSDTQLIVTLTGNLAVTIVVAGLQTI